MVETIFDDAQGHYEMVYAGWDGYHRIHGAILHVDIRDGKVWIQHDGTETGITDELLEAGIPYEHIVPAFHHRGKRKHTPYNVLRQSCANPARARLELCCTLSYLGHS